jgi:hypothetical protein
MSVFTRRNAIVGFVALKAASRALERRRGRERRSAIRRGLALGLGIVSVGVLAGLAAVYLRKRGGEPKHIEGYAEVEEEEEPAPSEQEAAEPIPATT